MSRPKRKRKLTRMQLRVLVRLDHNYNYGYNRRHRLVLRSLCKKGLVRINSGFVGSYRITTSGKKVLQKATVIGRI